MTALSQNSILRVALITLLIFSLGRYLLDGFLLPMVGLYEPNGLDLQPFYVAAYMTRERQNFYDYATVIAVTQQLNLPHQGYIAYIYPPFLANILVPLSFLPFPVALRVWILFQQVFVLGCVLLLRRCLPWLGHSGFLLLLIFAANFYPLYQTILYGQTNLLILLLLCATLLCYQRQNFFWAGVLLAFAAIIKMSPALLLLLFVLQRQWRPLSGFAVAIVPLAASSLFFNPPATVVSFFTNSLAQDIPRMAHWDGSLSPTTVLINVLDGLHLISNLRYASVFVILITLAVLVLPSFKQRAPASLEFALLFSIWLTGMLLISPLTWEHHLVFLLLPLAVLWVALARVTHLRRWHVLAVSYGVLYLLLAVDNFVLVRRAQTGLEPGWWIFSDKFLIALFSDIRFVGLVGFFILSLVVFRRLTRSASVAAQTETRQQELTALS